MPSPVKIPSFPSNPRTSPKTPHALDPTAEQQRHTEKHAYHRGEWPREDGMAFEVLSGRKAIRIFGIHRTLLAFWDERHWLLLRRRRILHHRWRGTKTLLLRIQRLQHCRYKLRHWLLIYKWTCAKNRSERSIPTLFIIWAVLLLGMTQ